MRAATILVLLLVMLALSVQQSVAADRVCDSIAASLVDSMILVETRGKPGDTVNLPITLKNTMGSTAFQMYVEFDTTLFRPLFDYESEFYVGTEETGVDTIRVTHYKFNYTTRVDATLIVPDVVEEIDEPSASPNIVRLRILAPPHPDNYFDLIPGIKAGTGQIITIPVEIVATAQQLDYVDVDFFAIDIYTDSIPAVFLGCQHSNYADSLGRSIRTSTRGSRLISDTLAAPLPQIVAFSATKDTVNAGESVTLAWQVSAADSVVLYSSVLGRIGNYSLSYSVTRTPTATTVYTLNAYNVNGEASSELTVYVAGSTPGNINPVVAAISPSSYTITQGETVSFSVSASDADNEFITLSALSLPANASFGTAGQVTGVGSVSGNFSFTPNTTQEGTFIVGFRATDNRGGVSAQVNVTIVVEAIEYDILFSKSRAEGSPVGGLANRTGILFPIDLVTSQPTVYGVQFDFHYDADYFRVDSIITTNRTAGWTIYDNIGQTPGSLRVVTFSMEGDSLITDETDGTTILWVAMSIDSLAPWGDYPITLDSGWESTDPDPQYPSLALVTDPGAIIQVDRPGDVNLDKRVDVADAVNIVGSILGTFTLVPRQFDVADLVIDLSVDVFDLVGVINTIYGLPVEQPSPAPDKSDEYATVSLAYEDMFVGSLGDMVVHSELPEDIAGVQLVIQYDPKAVVLGPPEPAVDASGLDISYRNGYGRMTVLLNFTNPFNDEQLVRRGLADLVTVPIMAQRDIEYGNEGQIDLVEVKLSTPTAKSVQVNGFGPTIPISFALRQNYPNPFNPTTRIEFSLSGSSERVSLDIYNVLGQHVRNLVDKTLPAGEYGVEWNATTDNGNKVATGVYLYRLQVGNRAETKKMLLLK